ncbi:MAG TPA: MauE/DoxX family redox-associated membrane protein [Acidimicrobiales bacterium]|jgi:hypothetical protein|nr:MauE/DoxX family redox-associated membrane protein [Acidimicrobiales bacterium]
MNSLLSAASVLLAGAGLLKLGRPANTAKALRVPVTVVRGAAAAEAGLGLAALFVGGWWPAVLVGASYVAFAAFVAGALVSGRPLATCGCFGEPDTPPTRTHVLVDLAFAGFALAAAATGATHPITSLGAASWIGAATVAYLAFLVLSTLPRLAEASRS